MKLNPYGKLCTQFYDITKPSPPEDAFKFYLKQAKSAGGPVLELMCGSGRFLISILEQGIEIEGADASADMLEACRAHCQAKRLKPVLYQQRIEELNLPKMYKLIIIPAASFVLVIDKRAASSSLKKIHHHLLPDGKLIIEIDTPRAAGRSGVWIGRWVERPDGASIIFNALASYDPKEKVESAIHKYELFGDGRLINIELEHYAMRFYEKEEFIRLLQEAGFKNIKATKLYNDTEPDETDHSIVFIADK